MAIPKDGVKVHPQPAWEEFRTELIGANIQHKTVSKNVYLNDVLLGTIMSSTVDGVIYYWVTLATKMKSYRKERSAIYALWRFTHFRQ